MLQGQLNPDTVNQLSQHIGAEPEQTASAMNGIFSSLLGGMANNAASPDGLQSLLGALDTDHDGSILDNLGDFLGGGTVAGAAPTALNGMGILKHVLGGQQEQVAEQVSQSSGLNMGQVMKLMPILAPILMGVLGKARGNGQLGIGNLASILLGAAMSSGQSSGMGGLLGGLLGGVLGGGQQQPQQQNDGGGLLGGLLGKVFGGR